MALPLGKGGYLRVTTPQTVDGTNLRYDDKNRPITKETHLPVTAKKHIERENESLPPQLKHTIEMVSDDEPVKPKAKPGPKPKAKEGEGSEQE